MPHYTKHNSDERNNMPYLTVYTNVDATDKNSLAEKASSLTASLLRKPESYVITNIIYNPHMAFGGSCQNKGALVELKSIGLGDKDKFVAELTSLLADQLQINKTQYIAITLTDAPASYTACGGRTFG